MKGLVTDTKEKNGYRVCVLMSTYNGQQFLGEQIESILSQEGVEVFLLVRDDASTDHTLEILELYRNKYPKQIAIMEGQDNIGWSVSFLTLLYKALEYDYPYYAFSDQDDVWKQEKLYNACEYINASKTNRGGVLHYANQMVVDDRRNKLFEVKEYKDWFERDISKKVVLLDGQVLSIGCVMTFNRVLLEQATQGELEILISGQVSHDYWIGAVAVYLGSVLYTNEVCIFHRRHTESVTNSGEKRKRRFFTKYRNYAQVLYQFYGEGNYLSEEDRKYLEFVARRKNLSGRLRLIRDREFRYPSRLSTLKLRLQIFLGIF